MEEAEKKSRLIKEMDASERPREKAIKYGFDALTDAELMAIIFSTGIKGKSVIDLCHDILDDNLNHLSLLMKMGVKELCRKYKGIGDAKATTLLAALELGKRAGVDANNMAAQQPINCDTLAYEAMKHHFAWLKHEEFWVLYLNRGGHPVKELRISQGGTGATVVDVKIVIQAALECMAASMILFHNHPSGTLRPSVEDDRLTSKLSEAARIFDMRVTDHLIITDGGYYSYSNHGKI